MSICHRALISVGCAAMSLLAAQNSFAQAAGEGRGGEAPLACPNKLGTASWTIDQGVNLSQVASDFPPGINVAGSALNQTQSNKHFGHTFQFTPPADGGCCQYNDGTLVVTYKAVNKGTSNKTSDAGNDTSGLVRNGASAPGGGFLWPNTGVAAGTVLTKTFTVPASWMASGRVSFYAQDDTAVTKATLSMSRCCITPTRPEK